MSAASLPDDTPKQRPRREVLQAAHNAASAHRWIEFAMRNLELCENEERILQAASSVLARHGQPPARPHRATQPPAGQGGSEPGAATNVDRVQADFP